MNYYTLNQIGPITISGEVAPDKLRAALAALDHELREVVKPGYITKEAVDGVKRTRIVGIDGEPRAAVGLRAPTRILVGRDGMDYFFGYVDTMAKQTPEDLRPYASRYIVGKPHVTGVVLSPETRRTLKLTEVRAGCAGSDAMSDLARLLCAVAALGSRGAARRQRRRRPRPAVSVRTPPRTPRSRRSSTSTA